MNSLKNLYVCKASAGTGKTYTLAAHYIALLMNNQPSRSILAVTFTNKATAEMKQRILTYLNAIASATSHQKTKSFLNKVREVSQTRGLSCFTDEEYAKKAMVLLRDNLSDFDNLCITTIDSFLQTLLSGLAQALGQSAGFGVDLDISHAITTAVDEVLSMEVNEHQDVRDTVVDHLRQRLLNEEKWDLRPGLIIMAEKLYKEHAQVIRDQIPLVSAAHPEYAKQLQNYKDNLTNFTSDTEFLQFAQYCHALEPARVALESGKGGRNYKAFFHRCDDILRLSGSNFRELGEIELNRLSPSQQSLARSINSLLPVLERKFNRMKICSRYLSDMMLVGYVLERIRHDQRERNTVLLTETAYTLFSALNKHDAEFVLLKAGIRYRHIMLDEFQDTSALQWSNFHRLIEEAISSQYGSTLIVGDVKQSIYRWRNGDYQIMNSLHLPKPSSHIHEHFNAQNLSCNFRSRCNVVEFNLSTFSKLTSTENDSDLKTMYDEGYKDVSNLSDYYAPKHQGGYVHLRQFQSSENKSDESKEVRKQLLTWMFTRMEELLAFGYRPKDMLILCRTSKEAKEVLKVFHTLLQDKTNYPQLQKAGKIVSRDSFLLESSAAVCTIISALKYITHHDKIALKFLTCQHPDLDVQQLDFLSLSLPLTDLVEQITSKCLCCNYKYTGTDIAYINCFRDKVRTYIGRYGSNIEDFLLYWDDKMHSDSIPSSESDDIQIMTIHTSKGLEAKNVFLPFCAWTVEVLDAYRRPTLWCEVNDIQLANPELKAKLPIDYQPAMNDIGFSDDYQEERRKQRIDAINLLYVACTRAEDNLFVLPFINNHSKNTIGHLLVDLYGDDKEWGEAMQRPQLESNEEDSMPMPFSFDRATADSASYYSANTTVQFRQSQMARQMMIQLSDSVDVEHENIEFGNLCHAILEKVQKREDVPLAVEDFYLRGLIPSQTQKQQIHSLLHTLVHHPIAGEWFDGSWQLLREDTVFSLNGSTVEDCRMDRVMLRDNRAIVLDYKFGACKPEYFLQVNHYMDIMRRMGYQSVRGYLWLGFSGELKEVN